MEYYSAIKRKAIPIDATKWMNLEDIKQTENEKTQGHRREGSVRTEAEMRMMHLKAKAGQELPPADLREA